MSKRQRVIAFTRTASFAELVRTVEEFEETLRTIRNPHLRDRYRAYVHIVNQELVKRGIVQEPHADIYEWITE